MIELQDLLWCVSYERGIIPLTTEGRGGPVEQGGTV